MIIVVLQCSTHPAFLPSVLTTHVKDGAAGVGRGVPFDARLHARGALVGRALEEALVELDLLLHKSNTKRHENGIVLWDLVRACWCVLVCGFVF